MDDNLLTVDEAAEQLRVSPDTVRRLLRDDKLVGVRVGGQWRVPADVLRAVSTRLGELLDEQVMLLEDHEVNGVNVSAGTLAYVVSHGRGVGGVYLDTIAVRESPLCQPNGANICVSLNLAEQNRRWKFVSNDGGSKALGVSRRLLRDVKGLLNEAYAAPREQDRKAAIENAYLLVRTALGKDDQPADDAIARVIDERMRAFMGLVPGPVIHES